MVGEVPGSTLAPTVPDVASARTFSYGIAGYRALPIARPRDAQLDLA